MQEDLHNKAEITRKSETNTSLFPRLRGLGVALVTPFLDNGEIDFPSLDRLLHFILTDEGGDFLVLFGTTGESPTITDDERIKILSLVRPICPPNFPIVIGVGDNNTQRLCNRLQHAVYKSTDAILSVTPYYNKPSQEGLYRHFMAVAEASPCPVLLYNIPGRCQVDLLPSTVQRLQKDSSNIIGIKEATGIKQRVIELRACCKEEFIILSGDDALTRQLCSTGAQGVISVVGNAYPQLIHRMVCATLKGEHKEAEAIDNSLHQMYKLLFSEGNPTGIKSLLYTMGLINSPMVRLPLCPASDILSRQIEQAHREMVL